MYGISRKIHERFINRKSKKHDEKYTVPFPTDIPNPSLVVFGTPGSGKCRMPLRIREIYCDQKEITNPFATKPTGFEVQTADDEDFKVNATTVKQPITSTSTTMTDVPFGKFVRVRTYNDSGSSKIVGRWSEAIKIK